jgi:GNAT superfamily N-acetyltransferase
MVAMQKEYDNELTLVRASAVDAETVVRIVHERAQRLQAGGIPQWKVYLTDGGAQDIREHVAGKHDAEVYLALSNGEAVGTFCLEWSDAEVWDERGADGRAGYIHTLATSLSMKGLGIGSTLLKLAEGAISNRHRPLARLDCWARSPMLVSYYPRFGFVDAGRKKEAQLFEKRVRP